MRLETGNENKLESPSARASVLLASGDFQEMLDTATRAGVTEEELTGVLAVREDNRLQESGKEGRRDEQMEEADGRFMMAQAKIESFFRDEHVRNKEGLDTSDAVH